MRFEKDKWYIGLKTSHKWGDRYHIFKGRPYCKSDYSDIQPFSGIEQMQGLEWRKASRVVIEPPEQLIKDGVPIEELVSMGTKRKYI